MFRGGPPGPPNLRWCSLQGRDEAWEEGSGGHQEEACCGEGQGRGDSCGEEGEDHLYG